MSYFTNVEDWRKKLIEDPNRYGRNMAIIEEFYNSHYEAVELNIVSQYKTAGSCQTTFSSCVKRKGLEKYIKVLRHGAHVYLVKAEALEND